jgi:hypothetical protein
VTSDYRKIRDALSGAASEKLTLQVVLVLLVLLVTAVALGVVGLGLASTTAMLALLDRTTLGVDVMELPI